MTNTGNNSLTGAFISDPTATLTTCTNSNGGGAIAAADAHTSTTTTLLPGKTWTCTATYTVTQGNVDAGSIDNTATGDTNETVSQNALKTITITRSPSFTLVKTDTTTTSPKKAGDTVTFSLTVTNTGNTTLANVTITDANAILGTCNIANGSNLEPSDTLTCSASHPVTQGEIEAGKTKINYTVSKVDFAAVATSKFDTPKTGYRVMTYEENQQMKKSGIQ